MENHIRNKRIDFFRWILMILILIHHFLVHGIGLKNLELNCAIGNVERIGWSLVVNSFVVIGVNSFFWISGYFGIQFKKNKIISLCIEVIFYILLINITLIICGAKKYSIQTIFTIIKYAFLFLNKYWFFTAYFALYLLSPYVNRMLDSLSPHELDMLIIICIFLNTWYGFVRNIGGIGDGYTVIQGVYIYILARYMYKRRSTVFMSFNRKVYFYLYVICSLVLGLLTVCTYSHGGFVLTWRLFSYNNPLLVLSACCLCLFVVYSNEAPPLIIQRGAKYAPYTFAIYLLTDYWEIRQLVFLPLCKVVENISCVLVKVPVIIVYVIWLSYVCIIIDVIRQKIFDLISAHVNCFKFINNK